MKKTLSKLLITTILISYICNNTYTTGLLPVVVASEINQEDGTATDTTVDTTTDSTDTATDTTVDTTTDPKTDSKTETTTDSKTETTTDSKTETTTDTTLNTEKGEENKTKENNGTTNDEIVADETNETVTDEVASGLSEVGEGIRAELVSSNELMFENQLAKTAAIEEQTILTSDGMTFAIDENAQFLDNDYATAYYYEDYQGLGDNYLVVTDFEERTRDGDNSNIASFYPWFNLIHLGIDIQLKFSEEGLSFIGRHAFENCSGLTGNLTIPDGVTTIGERAFYNCSGLTGDLIIPDGVTTIGEAAFYKCSGLTGDLTIPDGVITIGMGAFCDCFELNGKLVIPSTLTLVGSMAFTNLSNISNIEINVNLTDAQNLFGFYNLVYVSEIDGYDYVPTDEVVPTTWTGTYFDSYKDIECRPIMQIFNVTIPTELPVHVDSTGFGIGSNNAYITNFSTDVVVIKDLSINPINNWNVVSTNEHQDEKIFQCVNKKDFSISINDWVIDDDKDFTPDFLKRYNYLNGMPMDYYGILPCGEPLSLDYFIKISPQTETREITVAEVIFTLDWATEEQIEHYNDIVLEERKLVS